MRGPLLACRQRCVQTSCCLLLQDGDPSQTASNALTTPELWERQLMQRNDAAEQEALAKRKENLQETIRRLDKKRLFYLKTLGEQEKESTRSGLSTQIKEL